MPLPLHWATAVLLWACVALLFAPKARSAATGLFDSRGRLVQLENAERASRRGGTSVVALRSADNSTAVLFYWQPASIVRQRTSMQKIRGLASHVGLAATGLASDIEFIAQQGFDLASQHAQVFSSPIPVSRVAHALASEMHKRSMKRGWRPLGLRACLIGHHDDAAHVYELDPLGNLFCCQMTCIGTAADKIAAKLVRSVVVAVTDTCGGVAETANVEAKSTATGPIEAVARIKEPASGKGGLGDDELGVMVRRVAQALIDVDADAEREEQEEREGEHERSLGHLQQQQQQHAPLIVAAVAERLDVAVVGKGRPFALLSPGETRRLLSGGQ